jgi:hypothetical protein
MVAIAMGAYHCDGDHRRDLFLWIFASGSSGRLKVGCRGGRRARAAAARFAVSQSCAIKLVLEAHAHISRGTVGLRKPLAKHPP